MCLCHLNALRPQLTPPQFDARRRRHGDRQRLKLPGTSRETKALLDQLQVLRKNREKRDHAKEKKDDDARKARIGGRLVHLVRRNDSAATSILDQIRAGLGEKDRSLFDDWPVPPPVPIVEIPDRQRPRTLADIDAEIVRMKQCLKQQLVDEADEDQKVNAHRVIVLGGGLLALVVGGSRAASDLLGRIVGQIPAKERAPFKDWQRPVVPKVSPEPAAPGADDGSPKRATAAKAAADQGSGQPKTGAPVGTEASPFAAAPDVRDGSPGRTAAASGAVASPAPQSGAPVPALDSDHPEADAGPAVSAAQGGEQRKNPALAPSGTGGAAALSPYEGLLQPVDLGPIDPKVE